jgi:putative hydroxymethylpyrimidine transport system ATP-binding protein
LQVKNHPLPAVAPDIFFDRVSLSFNGTPLFDELSMRIDGGQCTCILGPSGCGKSTLLRLVSGTNSLDFTGSVRIGKEADTRSQTAWMGQKDLLLPWFSLLDNILLGAKLRKSESPTLRDKARSLLRQAGLAGSEDALPGSLSGGMRQRGALLRTLMEERSVLLMDEPFSALDALTRVKLQDLSGSMTRGATVLLVTHDPLEALRMGHTVVVLSGRPARVKSSITLGGTPPRQVDDPEIHRHYSNLLDQLMDERNR